MSTPSEVQPVGSSSSGRESGRTVSEWYRVAVNGSGRPASTPAPAVVHARGLAVAQLGRALDDRAERLAQGLVAEADAEHRAPGGRAALDDLDAASGVGRCPRTGADQHAVGLVREGHDVGGVVATHHRLGPELREVLDEVVDEAVVVVDDEDPHGAQPTVRPGGAGRTAEGLGYRGR